jgi:hypothetical protein
VYGIIIFAGAGILAYVLVVLVLGLVALIKCDKAAIPDVLRELARFAGRPDVPELPQRSDLPAPHARPTAAAGDLPVRHVSHHEP